MKRLTLIFIAKGHENILATHKSTLEITKHSHLTKRGDCIIGVTSNMSTRDLSDMFKNMLRSSSTEVLVTFRVRNLVDQVSCTGHPDLILDNPSSIVIRKSDYIDDRTLCINANKSARDINRELIKKLQDPNTTLICTITLSQK